MGRCLADFGRGNCDIPELPYCPRGPYGLDLEIFSMKELRERCSRRLVSRLHRYAFHTLVLVTGGTCTQQVDFEPVECRKGTLLLIRKGQAHTFGHDEAWDGWVLLYRADFLLPGDGLAYGSTVCADPESLAGYHQLSDRALLTVNATFRQMHEDTEIGAAPHDLHELLRCQLHSLLCRLRILSRRADGQAEVASRAVKRFRRFRTMLEQRFCEVHLVSEYARALGCTEKSLTRAAKAGAGISAKAFIVSRINLEAKRLLVHTDPP